jgi:hypothetical protein
MKGLCLVPVSAYVWLQWSRPWWLNHCFPPHLQELRCGWFYVSWVLHILAWMRMLTCVGSRCQPIWFDHFDVQSGWNVCDLYHFCIFMLQWSKPWWLNHCFAWHLQELRCGWFYVSWALHILAWMCMLTCIGSGCKPLWFDHFDVQSGWKGCDLSHFLQYVWLQWM